MGKRGKPFQMSPKATPEQREAGQEYGWYLPGADKVKKEPRRRKRPRRISASRGAHKIRTQDWVKIIDALAWGAPLKEALVINDGKQERKYTMYDIACAIGRSQMRTGEFLDTLRLRAAAGKIKGLVGSKKSEGDVGEIMWLMQAVNKEPVMTDSGEIANNAEESYDIDGIVVSGEQGGAKLPEESSDEAAGEEQLTE